jgi:hypothetical protein
VALEATLFQKRTDWRRLARGQRSHDGERQAEPDEYFHALDENRLYQY